MKSIYSAEYQRLLVLLIEARKDAAITQQELADRLGRPQSFVSKYERGERRLDIVEFLRVSKALGFDPYQVLKRLERVP